MRGRPGGVASFGELFQKGSRLRFEFFASGSTKDFVCLTHYPLGLTGSTVPARAAGSFSRTTVDARGADQTSALGINGARQVVGYLIDNKTHGFLRSATGALTAIDVPGASQTSALGINVPGRSWGTSTMRTARNTAVWRVSLSRDGKDEMRHFGPP